MTRWRSSAGRLQGGVLALIFVCVSACGTARGAQQPPPSFADLVKKVSPGVVNIIANKWQYHLHDHAPGAACVVI
jgi:S1-C subfamily serine protease